MGEFDYAKPKWWQWRLRDIERRKHLAFSEQDDVLTAVPFHRALKAINLIWVFATITFFLHVWIFRVLDPLYDFFWWFLFWVGWSGFVVSSSWFFSWSWEHWSETPKIILNGRMLLAPDWKPGMFVDTVDLPSDRKQPGRSAPPIEHVEVEYVPCRWGTSQVAVPRRVPYALVLRRNIEIRDPETGKVREKRAVFSDGVIHFAAKKAHWYLAGDLGNWRGIDWYERIRRKCGKRIKRRTWIGVALDPYEPVTWSPPGDKPALQKELFEEKGRNRSLENKSVDWMGRDADRASIERRRRGEE